MLFTKSIMLTPWNKNRKKNLIILFNQPWVLVLFGYSVEVRWQRFSFENKTFCVGNNISSLTRLSNWMVRKLWISAISLSLNRPCKILNTSLILMACEMIITNNLDHRPNMFFKIFEFCVGVGGQHHDLFWKILSYLWVLKSFK